MAGGDGSQALVASIAMERGVALVCVRPAPGPTSPSTSGSTATTWSGAPAFGEAIERGIDSRPSTTALRQQRVAPVYATVVQSRRYRDAKRRTTAGCCPSSSAAGRALRPPVHRPDGGRVTDAWSRSRTTRTCWAPLKRHATTPDGCGPAGRGGALGHDRGRGRRGHRRSRHGAARQRPGLATDRVQRRDASRCARGSGTAYAGVDGEALQYADAPRFEVHPRRAPHARSAAGNHRRRGAAPRPEDVGKTYRKKKKKKKKKPQGGPPSPDGGGTSRL